MGWLGSADVGLGTATTGGIGAGLRFRSSVCALRRRCRLAILRGDLRELVEGLENDLVFHDFMT